MRTRPRPAQRSERDSAPRREDHSAAAASRSSRRASRGWRAPRRRARRAARAQRRRRHVGCDLRAQTRVGIGGQRPREVVALDASDPRAGCHPARGRSARASTRSSLTSRSCSAWTSAGHDRRPPSSASRSRPCDPGRTACATRGAPRAPCAARLPRRSDVQIPSEPAPGGISQRGHISFSAASGATCDRARQPSSWAPRSVSSPRYAGA